METLQPQTNRRARIPHKCSFCMGLIHKDEIYQHSVHKFGGRVYTWKSHLKCSDIAIKLRMFDYADEGVTNDFFHESIIEEYRDLMLKINFELITSKEFKYPLFHDQLDFVIANTPEIKPKQKYS